MNKVIKEGLKIVVGIVVGLTVGTLGTWYWQSRPNQVVVVSPAPEEYNANIETDIEVEFKKKIDKPYLLVLNPEVEVEEVRVESDKLMVQLSSLEPGIYYEAKVMLEDEELFKWRFRTSKISLEEYIDELKEQKDVDYDLEAREAEYYGEREFVQSMPLVRDEYEIIYNSVTDKFTVIFKIRGADLFEVKQQYQEKVYEDLEAVGVERDKAAIEWTILVE